MDINNPAPGIETSASEEGEIENPFDVGYEGDGKVLKADADMNLISLSVGKTF